MLRVFANRIGFPRERGRETKKKKKGSIEGGTVEKFLKKNLVSAHNKYSLRLPKTIINNAFACIVQFVFNVIFFSLIDLN